MCAGPGRRRGALHRGARLRSAYRRASSLRPAAVWFVLVSLSVGGRIDTQRACFGVAGQDASDGRINDHVNLHELDAALQCWLAIRQNKGEVWACELC